MTKELSPLRQKDIRQGEKQERERIIALLTSDPEGWISCGGGERAAYESAIALIKGENK